MMLSSVFDRFWYLDHRCSHFGRESKHVLTIDDEHDCRSNCNAIKSDDKSITYYQNMTTIRRFHGYGSFMPILQSRRLMALLTVKKVS